MENQLDSVTEKPTCSLRLQGLACDWSKHNKHSRNIFSVHGFLRLSVNVDYKIASKVITKRIERVLPSLIRPDQTSFMKGRYIGQNIRLINDIIQQTELQKIPGILLLLDFQKAFDTLQWPFIQNTLNLFNFGNDIKKMDLYVLYEF